MKIYHSAIICDFQKTFGTHLLPPVATGGCCMSATVDGIDLSKHHAPQIHEQAVINNALE